MTAAYHMTHTNESNTLQRNMGSDHMNLKLSSDCKATKTNADDELLSRVAAKDRNAFDALYRLYQPQLFRFLLRLTRRPEMTQELINDVMFVVWQKAPDFRYESKVSTWIFGIAYRRALKSMAKAKKYRQHRAADPVTNVDGPQVEIELHDWLERGLTQLSPVQRVVVELTYYFGCSYQEIAEIAQCPVNTVKTRMFSARRRLRSTLTEFGNPGSSQLQQRIDE